MFCLRHCMAALPFPPVCCHAYKTLCPSAGEGRGAVPGRPHVPLLRAARERVLHQNNQPGRRWVAPMPACCVDVPSRAAAAAMPQKPQLLQLPPHLIATPLLMACSIAPGAETNLKIKKPLDFKGLPVGGPSEPPIRGLAAQKWGRAGMPQGARRAHPRVLCASVAAIQLPCPPPCARRCHPDALPCLSSSAVRQPGRCDALAHYADGGGGQPQPQQVQGAGRGGGGDPVRVGGVGYQVLNRLQLACCHFDESCRKRSLQLLHCVLARCKARTLTVFACVDCPPCRARSPLLTSACATCRSARGPPLLQ